MRRLIARFLLFCMSVVLKLLFSKKQRVKATRRMLREEHVKVRAELVERGLTKTYSLTDFDMPKYQ